MFGSNAQLQQFFQAYCAELKVRTFIYIKEETILLKLVSLCVASHLVPRVALDP
jgi:hypothetical protein